VVRSAGARARQPAVGARRARGGGDAERLLRLTVALFRFWYVPGHLAEARRRLVHALAQADDQPALMRRRAVTAAAAVALLQGDYAAAMALADAVELARGAAADTQTDLA
jgi:hypothetical protein